MFSNIIDQCRKIICFDWVWLDHRFNLDNIIDLSTHTKLQKIILIYISKPIEIIFDYSSIDLISICAIDCPNIKFTNLPDNLLRLTINNCNKNTCDFINLPISLIYLNCTSNLITKLNNLPDKLISLNCSYNKIKSLDMLPDSLLILDCSHNLITDLKNLPTNLNILICTSNLLVDLNYLPKNLSKLICPNNHISSINAGNLIWFIDAYSNPLESIVYLNPNPGPNPNEKLCSIAKLYLCNIIRLCNVSNFEQTNINPINKIAYKIKWIIYKIANIFIRVIGYLFICIGMCIGIPLFRLRGHFIIKSIEKKIDF